MSKKALESQEIRNKIKEGFYRIELEETINSLVKRVEHLEKSVVSVCKTNKVLSENWLMLLDSMEKEKEK